jgi:cytochrome P450
MIARDVDVRAADQALEELFGDPQGVPDPFPLYRRIREVAPIYRSEVDGTWYVSRFEDCRALLNDLRCGRDIDRPNPSLAFRSRPMEAQIQGSFRSLLIVTNPPEHTRLRGAVSEAFTWRRLKALEPRIAELADQRLDVLAEKGDADIVADLAFPLPVAVIGELVGVPPDEREQFRDLVIAGLVGGDQASGTAATLEAYFADLVARRRARPQDDLVSGLVSVPDGPGRLSDEEVIAMAMIVFLAGFLTTTNLIGNGLVALLEHPHELERLRRDPALIETAVQEMLRFDTAIHAVGRAVLQPTELAGQPLAAGETVICLIGGANRDPERFPDPDRFDVGRSNGPALSFGWGIHHCLGSVLASLEGRVVFERMLRRFDTIALRDDDPPVRASFLRGWARLPIRVAQARSAGG